jgi:hypothetical protein
MNMKAAALCLLVVISLIHFDVQAQKVQFKKGQIFVDKELKFELVEVENKDKSSNLNDYFLKDLDGNDVFAMRVTPICYEQLPNETSCRPAFEAYRCTAPAAGFEGDKIFLPVMGFGKQRIKDLEKAGFFKTLEFDQGIFDAFIGSKSRDYISQKVEEVKEQDKVRLANYKLTEATFGPLLERDPKEPDVVINTASPGSFKIQEGNLDIANVNLREEGSNNHAYDIVNHNGDIIGHINIFQKPVDQNGSQKYRYNVKPLILGEGTDEQNYKWFYEKAEPGTPVKSTTYRIEQVARYMVMQGML